jgi:predicted nucleic acid-binding protein
VGTLVDTSVLIAAQRADIDFDALLAAHGNQDIAVATICASELMHGPHRLTNAVARARAGRTIEALLACFSIVDFDLEIARLHARLGADLAAKGTAVGAHDLIVAATALSLDYRIATRDRRSFPQIPGLDVTYW